VKFYVIGDRDTVLGFALAGVDGEIVDSAEQTQKALTLAFQKEDLGVIIIPERTASEVRHQIDQYVYKTTFPLIIEIPNRLGPMEGRGSIRDLIRTAVGIHI
jgi:V/A-type H+-transporting ATPase subunit F